MNSTLINLLLTSAICLPVAALAQTESASFNIGTKKYYLHKIAYTPHKSDFDISKGEYNQTMVADNDYIYVADHEDIAYSRDHLTIKRYSVLTGARADDLVIGSDQPDYYYIAELTNTERCFYLLPSNNDDYLILFMYAPWPAYGASGNTKDGTWFYIIDKTGKIVKDFHVPVTSFSSTFYTSSNTLDDFGVPEVIGDAASGNFDIFIPMVNNIGQSLIAKYSYTTESRYYEPKTITQIYYRNNGISTTTKPSVHIVDDNFMIVDDIGIAPSLYSYKFNFNNCYASLPDTHILGHGMKTFNYQGHRFLSVGDVKYADGSTTDGITQFKIGLWDESPAASESQPYPSLSFDSFTTLATLSFGTSTAKNKVSPYTYRQFTSVTDFGNNVIHLHFYVPGEFLATYQLNEYDIPTSVGEVTDIIENQEVGYHISDKTIIFDTPISEVSVFNMVGHTIFHSENPVKSINLANFVKGTYIVSTPYQSFKILL